MHCINSKKSPDGCGNSESCKKCVIRNSINSAFQDIETHRELHQLELVRNDTILTINVLISASPFEHEGKKLAVLTIEDVSELQQLRELIPICASCKNVRNDEDYWQTVEEYFRESSVAQFSHSICPECMKKLYPEFALNKKKTLPKDKP